MRRSKIWIGKITKRNGACYWQVHYRDAQNKRKAKAFATKGAAEAYQQAREIELHNFGIRALNLSDSARDDAQKGLELLAPHGKSLLDAVRFFVSHLEQNQRSCVVDELVPTFLQDKDGQGVSRAHMYDLRQRLKRFAGTFGDRTISTLTADEIGLWIKSLPLSPQSKLHYRRVLCNFLGFAVRRRYAEANPVLLTPQIKVPEGEIEIYSPAEMTLLLENADPYVVPYLALGGFAGIRRAELLRLKWEDIRFQNGCIFITAGIAKTQSKRVIPITDNLRKWIFPLAQPSGLIIPQSGKLRKLIDAACKKAGVKWKPNALRHSFASYRLAKTNDLNMTAVEMGNTPPVTNKHYRQLVTKEQAAEYWQIEPKESFSDKIIPLAAAA